MRLVPAVLGLVVLPFAARADAVLEQMDQARQYYQEGDISGAISELEFTIQELRGKLGTAYLATFPEPPSGWSVVEVLPEASGTTMPFLGGGNMLQREYRSASGEQTISVQLMTGGSFLQGLASMFMSPQVMAGQPNARRVRIGRENAVVTYDAAGRGAQLMLDLGGRATIMLEGQGLDSGEPLVELVSRWDLDAVRKIAAP